MRQRDVAELVALAALWGGSFLFMRIAVPEFGPVAVAAGTGLANVLHCRLIANAGPANAVAVTYLVPVFAVAWGALFLD